jgi:hypothetical protein
MIEEERNALQVLGFPMHEERKMVNREAEMHPLDATFDALSRGAPLPIALFWGIGKTTLLQHIAGRCRDESCVIWVDIHRGSLREQGGFYEVNLAHSGNITAALIKVLLEQRRAVLLSKFLKLDQRETRIVAQAAMSSVPASPQISLQSYTVANRFHLKAGLIAIALSDKDLVAADTINQALASTVIPTVGSTSAKIAKPTQVMKREQ